MITLEPTSEEYRFYERIVRNACALQGEEEWLEFKHSNSNPDLIGQYLCALGNAACICQKDNGYLIYGIDDASHKIVGTSFDPSTAKKGGEALESYLGHMLSKNAYFKFVKLFIEDRPIVIGVAMKAVSTPISFAGTEYIRVGSSLKKLKDFPESERKLWLSLSVFDFESMSALDHVEGSKIIDYLDLSCYYRNLQKPYPSKEEGILLDLTRDGIIREQDDGRFAILNCGALAIARDLSLFPSVSNRGIRIIFHQSQYLTSFSSEKTFDCGYAISLEQIVDYIDDRAGREEKIDAARRQSVHAYPPIAIREIIANAAIHQDLTSRGASIIVHLYPDRLTVTNPGKLLCDVKRSIDALPKARNEELARILRKMGFVEEQGSGFDRIEECLASEKMPSVLLETDEQKTVATLFHKRGYREFDKDDLTRTSYTFACLRHFNGLELTNSDLRERLGIEEKNAAIASRILKECIAIGALKSSESKKDKRSVNYLPFYA